MAPGPTEPAPPAPPLPHDKNQVESTEIKGRAATADDTRPVRFVSQRPSKAAQGPGANPDRPVGQGGAGDGAGAARARVRFGGDSRRGTTQRKGERGMRQRSCFIVTRRGRRDLLISAVPAWVSLGIPASPAAGSVRWTFGSPHSPHSSSASGHFQSLPVRPVTRRVTPA